MSEVDHVGRAVAAVADEAVRDAVAAVKAHPEYQRAIESLSGAALDALLRAVSVGV